MLYMDKMEIPLYAWCPLTELRPLGADAFVQYHANGTQLSVSILHIDIAQALCDRTTPRMKLYVVC